MSIFDIFLWVGLILLFTGASVLTYTQVTQNRKKRLELRKVSYAEADALLKAGWLLAKEEDDNHEMGAVFLERVE